jgi:hypothetical protein
MTTWWISFASDTQSLGVVLVDTEGGFLDAMKQIADAGINPGGQVAGWAFDQLDERVDIDDQAAMAQLPRLTLLTKAQVEGEGVETCPIDETFGDKASVVCEGCNDPAHKH